MRITIETESREDVSVVQNGQLQPREIPDVTDGGEPPQELLELLSGEQAEDHPEQEASETDDLEDAGAVPDWLVDVIEGTSPPPSGPDNI